MEELNNMEQPSLAFENTANVGEQNTQGKDGESINESNVGSTQFGKFKDATTLYDAYINLQKEFTRKSQQLSEILKSNDNNQISNKIEKNSENDGNFSENNSQNTVFDDMQNKNLAYKKNDWTNKAMAFFNSKNDAKKYAKEISELLIADRALAQSDNCLEYAYAIVKNKDIKEPASYLTDQSFLEENIFNNNSIKNKIIEDYLSSAIKNKSVKVITGQAENLSLTKPGDKPKNIKEASLILKKLLQQ